MSNVISMEQPCAYYVARAAKHRLAGRYDEAMALLGKAKDLFGLQEDVELEMARLYEALECDEEAVRSYLRIVRLNGIHQPLAYFQLAIHCIGRGELNRALLFYQSYRSSARTSEVSAEAAAAFEAQLLEQAKPQKSLGCKKRAKALEQRAIEKMHAGKAAAASRAMKHASALAPTARGYTLLACCSLLRGRAEEAVGAARQALLIRPGRVQTRCVLIDALHACGAHKEARNELYLASFKIKSVDDALAVAIEGAKYGEDRLTLRMTAYILKRKPFHVRAMMLRGCALMNLGRAKEAARFFGRICGLLPENTVCEAYYRMARSGEQPQRRLDLGMEVDAQESFRRMSEVMRHLVAAQGGQWPDPSDARDLCRLCAWTIESAAVGAQAKTAAVLLLVGMNSDAARGILEDCLMDAHTDDCFKLSMLKILTAKEGFKPYWVDLDGKLVRLAAGGVSPKPAPRSVSGNSVVQCAADALIKAYPDAPEILLNTYLKYIELYPVPKGNGELACAASLEYAYISLAGGRVPLKRIAGKYGRSGRLCARYARRILPLMAEIKKTKAERRI